MTLYGARPGGGSDLHEDFSDLAYFMMECFYDHSELVLLWTVTVVVWFFAVLSLYDVCASIASNFRKLLASSRLSHSEK